MANLNPKWLKFTYAYFSISILKVLAADDFIPDSFMLGDVYPKPFNPIANFNIEIPEHTNLVIDIYNI